MCVCYSRNNLYSACWSFIKTVSTFFFRSSDEHLEFRFASVCVCSWRAWCESCSSWQLSKGRAMFEPSLVCYHHSRSCLIRALPSVLFPLPQQMLVGLQMLQVLYPSPVAGEKSMTWEENTGDALYSLMLMCKEGEGNKDAFVRCTSGQCCPISYDGSSFRLDAWWSCSVLYSTWQFFSVLSVDPTFSLGSFDVTVTTDCYLLLKSSEKHLYMIGRFFRTLLLITSLLQL